MSQRRTGRPPAIRSRGEMTGAADWRLPAAALEAFGRYFDNLDEHRAGAKIEGDEPAVLLAAAWAAYRADAEALAAMPSAGDERADLRAIAADARALAATQNQAVAMRLWRRLANFPPVSRSLISPTGPGLLAFESVLGVLVQALPRPMLWPAADLPETLRALAEACESCPPVPTFTKRPQTARARLIVALRELWDRCAEPDGKERERFIRAMLEAFGVPVPDRL